MSENQSLVRIGTIKIQIGGKEVEMTLDEARTLKMLLCDLFPEQTPLLPGPIEIPYPWTPNNPYPGTPVIPWPPGYGTGTPQYPWLQPTICDTTNGPDTAATLVFATNSDYQAFPP